MKCLLAPFVLLAAHAAFAQDWATQALQNSPRHREWVTVNHDGRAVETFVAYPEWKDKTPAVLVIHGIVGMTDRVQDLTEEMAAAGYIAAAPDLLSGTRSSCDGINSPRKLARPDATPAGESSNVLPAIERAMSLGGAVPIGHARKSRTAHMAVPIRGYPYAAPAIGSLRLDLAHPARLGGNP